MDRDGFMATVEAYRKGEEVKCKETVEKGIFQALAGTKEITVNPVGRSNLQFQR